jgi:hypothetical protein
MCFAKALIRLFALFFKLISQWPFVTDAHLSVSGGLAAVRKRVFTGSSDFEEKVLSCKTFVSAITSSTTVMSFVMNDALELELEQFDGIVSSEHSAP